MKNILFWLLLYSPIPVFSQIDIYNLILTDSTIPEVYIGIYNILKVKGVNVNNDNYVLTAEKGDLKKMENGLFILRIYTEGDATITITKKGKVVFTKTYRGKLINTPRAIVAGIMDTIVSARQILINPGLQVIVPGTHWKHELRIISFEASFLRGDDSLSTYSLTNKFSQEQLRLIKVLRSGDKIFFNNIRVLDADSRMRKLSPFTMTIKE